MTTYYVDSSAGSDSASGTSAGSAWRSVEKVNDFNLRPGDTVLFRAGNVYSTPLEPPTSGTADQPITFGSYGSGPAPVFTGAVDVVDKAWTQVSANVWKTALPQTGWFQPEKLQIDGETANVRSAGLASVDQPGDWYWSGGTLYVHSSANPSQAFDSVEAAMGNYGILVKGVDHVRLVGLEAEMANQGVIIRESTGTQAIGLEVHDNARNGINIKASDGVLIEGGSSRDNGIDGLGTSTKHQGHGVLFIDGATNNLVSNMMLRDNAEDGVQFSNDSGNGNVVRGSMLTGNREDGVDMKNGAQTLEGNSIWGNAANGVMLHQTGRVLTLRDNDIRAVGGGNALLIGDGGRVVSDGNVYGGEASYTIRVNGTAADGSSFANDTFVDGGSVSGVGVLLVGGKGHSFTYSTFVMREPGYALQVKLAASGVTISNSILYGRGLLQMDTGTDVGLDGNLYWSTGADDRWVRLDGPRKLYDRDYLLARDVEGIAADPLFADATADDFTLRAGSPASGLGAAPDDDASSGATPPPEPEPEPELLPEPEPEPVDDTAPGGSLTQITGTSAAESIVGTAAAERIAGLGGGDTLRGMAGDDVLLGWDGDDVLVGGDGNDILAGGAGRDDLRGGAGFDTVWYGDAAGGIVADLKLTEYQAVGGGQGEDHFHAIENATGSGFDDRLYGTGNANQLDGGAGDDRLWGRHGDDRLLGGDGNDTLFGGGGADTLAGGRGDDLLHGEGGADLFEFAAGDGADRIADFGDDDRLRLAVTGVDDVAAVLARATETAAGVVIDLGGGDSVTLEGLRLADLDAGQFVF